MAIVFVVLLLGILIWWVNRTPAKDSREVRSTMGSPTHQILGYSSMREMEDAAILTAASGVHPSQTRLHHHFLIGCFGREATDAAIVLIRSGRFKEVFPSADMETALASLGDYDFRQRVLSGEVSAPQNSERSEISIPGGDPAITIPAVSFDTAASEEELNRLYLTAVAGAANLIVPIIQQRLAGSLSITIVRSGALQLVQDAHSQRLVPSNDTNGLYIGARTLLETLWEKWDSVTDPHEELRRYCVSTSDDTV